MEALLSNVQAKFANEMKRFIFFKCRLSYAISFIQKYSKGGQFLIKKEEHRNVNACNESCKVTVDF